MNILILGGTQFLGRHITQTALGRGHTVTLFNRGRTNPHLFPEVEKLHGDRQMGDLDALRGRRWDAVIDVNGYLPRIVRQSVELLAGAHYTFISTISVYAAFTMPLQDEDAPLAELADESVEDSTGETYGGLKALCEHVVQSAIPGRALVIRPGLIVGPDDPSDRFTYWVERAARGGEVLVPDARDMPAQFIDVRDLAAFVVTMVEGEHTGVYNATGVPDRVTFGALLDACKQVSGSDAAFVPVSEAFLMEQEVAPWQDLPIWLPADMHNLHRTSVERALKLGLTLRPLADTVRDTLAWARGLPADRPRRAGLSPEREAGVLRAWRGRTSAEG